MQLLKYNDNLKFVGDIVSLILESAKEAIANKGNFHIVLCGGRTPIPIYEELSKVETNWDCWHFWLGDERILPSSEGFNCQLINDNFLSKISTKKININFFNIYESTQSALQNYKIALKSIDYFDFALLGIGEDGHTASLFPGNDLGNLQDSEDVLLIDNSPKEPVKRISLSANKLSQSKKIIFIASGTEKFNIINQIMLGKLFPCNLINGKQESLLFFLK